MEVDDGLIKYTVGIKVVDGGGGVDAVADTVTDSAGSMAANSTSYHMLADSHPIIPVEILRTYYYYYCFLLA